MARPNPVGRLDNIIEQLEVLHADAQQIFNAHVDALLVRQPSGTAFGVLKYREIAVPAESALNYVAALKMLREKFTGEPYPGKPK